MKMDVLHFFLMLVSTLVVTSNAHPSPGPDWWSNYQNQVKVRRTDDPCPAPFIALHTKCIKLIRSGPGLSWDWHHEQCLNNGGNHLLELPTADSLAHVHAHLVQNIPGYKVWVGGRRNHNGIFQWPSGTDVSLNWGWEDGEPNNPNEMCMELIDNGGGYLNDRICGANGASVCEKVI